MRRFAGIALSFWFVFVLGWAGAVRAAAPPPLFTRTYTVAAAGQTAAHDTFAAVSPCDGPSTLYTLSVTNGRPDGTGRVKDGSISVNGVEVAAKELASGAASFERNVLVAAANTVDVTLHANADAEGVVTVAIRRAMTATVYDEAFSLTSAKKGVFDATIAVPAGRYTLVVTNGSAAVLPVDDIELTLNGALLVAKADVDSRGNQDERQTLFRTVDLVASNGMHLELSGNRLPATAGVRIVRELQDVAPPAITISAPANGAAVKTQSVTISGRVTDDAAPASLTIGGVPVPLAADGSFTHAATLAPGANTIALSALDCAGNRTDASRSIYYDTTPPVLTVASPVANAIVNGKRVYITGTATDDDAIASVTVNGVAAVSDVAGWVASVLFDSDGAHALTVVASDRSGRTSTIVVPVMVDGTAPVIAVDPPASPTRNAEVVLRGSVTDAVSGVVSVDCEGQPATLSGKTFTCPVTLREGDNYVVVSGFDAAHNRGLATLTVRLDTHAPAVTITSPLPGNTINAAAVTITGTVDDDDEIAKLTVGGHPVTPSSSKFTYVAALVEGANTFAVEAVDRAGNTATNAIAVTRFTVPSIAITSPADLSVDRNTTVTVRGTIDDAAAAVDVNGIAATVSGTTFTAGGVPLVQGRTVITATATTAAGHAATTSINVYRDSIPPRLTVDSPKDGATVYASPISITGTVDDIVVGTINARQMRVTVNGVAATVANRSFLLDNVALAAGMNTLLITATDEGNNSTVVSYHVTLATASQPRLVIASGGGQTATIGKTLAQPVVVRALAPDGSAIANAALTFKIIENNGTIASGTSSGRTLSVTTNAQGNASVAWTLGTRAGAGNNRLEVSGSGFAAPVEASAIALTSTPHFVVVDAGNNQFGIAGEPLQRPLVAVVVDSGSNRLANVPVVFTAKSGGGLFGGQPSISVLTDSDGRAIVQPVLGPNAGEDNNVFAATAAGAATQAVFVASGRNAGPISATRISGVVLDNTMTPIAGVSVRIDGTSVLAHTDASGQFTIANAPVGYVKLLIDGSTAQRSGTWPTLEYALYSLPGVDNNVGMPIYLLPIDVTRGVFTDDTTGGTLTIPELPGFSLKIAPGSATFPGGGRTGTVSATLVHADRIPMAPGFGQQPQFIVTIQPPGVHFDPPAAITFPNLDGLAPGEITELYSFDHDLGQFVAIGTGSAGEDGSSITSDPGVGIIKGGWHCGGNPNGTGTTGNCPECQTCGFFGCTTDSAKEQKICDNNECKVCTGGKCTNVTSEEPPPLADSQFSIEQVPPSWTFTGPFVDHYGGTYPEDMSIEFDVRCDGGNWHPVVTKIVGKYSSVSRLTPPAVEVGSPTKDNFCEQARALFQLGNCKPYNYYMISAVQAHENVHISKLLPQMKTLAPGWLSQLQALSIASAPGLTAQQARDQFQNMPQFQKIFIDFFHDWQTTTGATGHADDHVDIGDTFLAERAVVSPVLQGICSTASKEHWGFCQWCALPEPPGIVNCP